jgi:hypothetical protein
MLRKAIAACGLVTAATAASLVGTSPAFAQQDPGVYYPTTVYIPSSIPSTTFAPPVFTPERLGTLQEQLRSREVQAALEHETALEQMRSQERQTALQHEQAIEQMRSQERVTALEHEKVAEQMRSQDAQTKLQHEKALEQARSGQQTGTAFLERPSQRQTIASQDSEEVER